MFSEEAQTSFSLLQKLQVVIICVLIVAGVLSLFPLGNKPFNGNNNNIASIKTVTAFNHQPIATIYPASNKEIITNEHSTALTTRPVTNRRRIAKCSSVNKQGNDYTIALINDALLKNHKQLIALAANDKEDADSSYYVKIEEQQSGNKQMNVYYFQLTKNNGATIVNPLILLSKPVVDVNKIVNNAVDSAINSHKRITL